MVISSSGIRRGAGLRFLLAVCFVVLPAAFSVLPARAEDSLDSLRAEFKRQNDPAKRAKLFPKLGNALIAEMRKLESTRQYDGVAPLFLEYRDSAVAAFNALVATGRDAEKHSAGFREMEMHLRQSLHQLNDLIFGLPVPDREPLEAPQKELQDIDDKLIKALFPRGPEPHKTPPSAPQQHPQL